MNKNFVNSQIITDGDLSGNITSPAIKSQLLDKLNVFVSWSNGSTPSGSLIIEGTVDGENWEDVGVTEPTISGASGTGFVIVDTAQMCWANMRVRWAFTSGSGTLQCWIHGKNL